jgi:hypothetical protein
MPLMPWNATQLSGVSHFGQGVLLVHGATEDASMATLGGSDARTAGAPRRTMMAVNTWLDVVSVGDVDCKVAEGFGD